MSKRLLFRAAITCLVLALALPSLLWFVYRPWALNWGSTAEERSRPMPGDDVLWQPSFSATRAVTIEATPEEIWPWIVQIGYLRAGFYSYDRLDNDGVPSADRILPEYQSLEVGELVPLAEGANARVTVLEPPSLMLLVFEMEEGPWKNATWAWGLYPEGAAHARLVTRLRANAEQTLPRLFLEFGEIVMMRKCMLGIKDRASAGRLSRG
jgi:hypothetical protein